LLLALYKVVLNDNNANEKARELYNKRLLRRQEYQDAKHFITKYIFFIATNFIDLRACYR